MGRFAALLAVGLAGAMMAAPAGCTTPVNLSQATGTGGGTGGTRSKNTGGAAGFDASADGAPSGPGTGGASTVCLDPTEAGVTADAAEADAHPAGDGGACLRGTPDPPAFP